MASRTVIDYGRGRQGGSANVGRVRLVSINLQRPSSWFDLSRVDILCSRKWCPFSGVHVWFATYSLLCSTPHPGVSLHDSARRKAHPLLGGGLHR